MARYVGGATNNFLSASAAAIPYPFTLACRFKADVLPPKHIMTYGMFAAPSDVESIYGDSGTAISAYTIDATFSAATVGAAIVADQWHSAIAVYASASSRRIYFDGSIITAFNGTLIADAGISSKSVVLGGVLASPTTLYGSGENFLGDVADAAIWNIALTAADVDALVTGRPGDVQAANLKGWWKLGEDGSLANSAGSAFPAMTVNGTCPVSDDPEYPGEVVYKPGLIYSPRTFSSITATDPTAPSRDKLQMWHGGLAGRLDYWSNRQGHDYAENVNKVSLSHGIDNSTRQLIEHVNPTLRVLFTPASLGLTMTCWLRIYSWNSPGIGGGGYAFYGMVPLVYTGIYSTYPQLFVYTTDAPAAYGAQRRISFTRNKGDFWPYFSTTMLPTDEWVHVAVTCSTGTDETVIYYINGKADGTHPSSMGATISTDTFLDIHASAGDVYCDGDYASKDWRYYGAVLSADEVYQVYLHSKDFHEATSGLILTAIRPARIEYIPDPTGVPDSYVPNTDLSWVQKATHIWALHPTDPLKADKGGNTLVLEAGTPTALASPENTMEFHGAEYYKTTATITFGDNPLVAGNQTPPIIGSVSLWIYPYDLPVAGSSRRVFGGATDAFRGGQIHFTNPNQSVLVQSTTSFSHPVINAWRHVCLTHNGTHRRLFLNGVKVNEGTNVSALVMTDQLYRIGFYEGSGPASLPFNGRLRLVAMVNGVEWTDAEILEQYQRPYAYYAPVPPPTIVTLQDATLEIQSHLPLIVPGALPVFIQLQDADLELLSKAPMIISGPVTVELLSGVLEIVSHLPAYQAGTITIHLRDAGLEIQAELLGGTISGPVSIQLANAILELVSYPMRVRVEIIAPGRRYYVLREDRTIRILHERNINEEEDE